MASRKGPSDRMPPPEVCFLLAAALGGAGILSATVVAPVSLGFLFLALSAWFLVVGLVWLSGRAGPGEEEGLSQSLGQVEKKA